MCADAHEIPSVASPYQKMNPTDLVHVADEVNPSLVSAVI